MFIDIYMWRRSLCGNSVRSLYPIFNSCFQILEIKCKNVTCHAYLWPIGTPPSRYGFREWHLFIALPAAGAWDWKFHGSKWMLVSFYGAMPVWLIICLEQPFCPTPKSLQQPKVPKKKVPYILGYLNPNHFRAPFLLGVTCSRLPLVSTVAGYVIGVGGKVLFPLKWSDHYCTKDFRIKVP